MYKFKGNALHSAKSILVNNKPVVRAIDCVEGSFMVNKYGHIRSDFAVLTETTSGLEFAKALQNMQNCFVENSSQFDGLTFEEMVALVRPRWCQLPGEVDRFEQYLIDNALEFYKNLRKDEVNAIEDEGGNADLLKKPATLAPETTQPSE